MRVRSEHDEEETMKRSTHAVFFLLSTFPRFGAFTVNVGVSLSFVWDSTL